MLGYHTQRTDLRALANGAADAHHTPDADRLAIAQSHRRRDKPAMFDDVLGNTRVRCNHDLIAELEQAVIHELEAVDPHTTSDARAVQAKVQAPQRR